VSRNIILISQAIAVVVIVVGSLSLLNAMAGRLPARAQRWAMPLVMIGPALLLLVLMYLGPTVLTVAQSMQNRRGEFVGLDNYRRAASNSQVIEAVTNTVLWTIVVPIACVVLGLVAAALSDVLSPRGERTAKTLIFLPMAISFVGASTIWTFVYAYQPPGSSQVGLLNQIMVWLGRDPVPWTIVSDYRLNTFVLMVIVIWMYTGFAMVSLSAAIKGVPLDTVEAARVDGLSEFQVFRYIVLPQITSTIAVMLVSIALLTLKVFDVVYSMTGGRFGTDVVGNLFYTLLFSIRDAPLAAVLVVVLLVLVIPVMALNVRRFAKEEAAA
jgi:alpha-glucoside transport system permease protein